MKKAIGLFSNKYVIAFVCFLVWMLFFDRNDLMSQYDYFSQRQKLEEEKEFYQQEITKVLKDLQELSTDQERLEKFAREKYLMKKENEDVFVIVPKKDGDEDSKTLF